MGLAGESLVQARWLNVFSSTLANLKKQHERLTGMLDTSLQAASTGQSPEQIAQLLAETRQQAARCREEMLGDATEFDDHAARAEELNTRLYREVIASRMRPFSDGLHGLARTVRDMARSLGKQARLEVVGESTDVDRDVLEKLESPLSHLIRNAVDHGLEPTDERTAAGKPPGGTVRVEARHRAGMLSVTISDDGRGVDLDKLRKKVGERGLSSPELVQRMNEAELLEFLFLPGFSTAGNVTEYSGRGVGLDVVQDAVRRVGGSVRISTRASEGTSFHLQLPITLSVIRAVVVEVGGEPYAFPHTRIDRLLRVPRESVHSLEHRQFVAVDRQNVGLVLAGQLLDVPADPPKNNDMPVVLLSDVSGIYGLVVDAFRGEQDLVVRPLDPRLGKVPNLSAAAVLDDGEPVLLLDVEDLVRSMDTFIQTGALRRCEVRDIGAVRKKRVLVVDDSITVREVERQLLLHQGYEVTVAVDGMDGWNQVRGGKFDLVVSDVDMPRMSGLQLVQAIRADDRLKHLPVVIVSYKEREEDRLRGLEVGANHYLTKSSFHDNRFVQAVQDLIGTA
jgi:two-component system sensor histidine kinase and response regulator WspE